MGDFGLDLLNGAVHSVGGVRLEIVETGSAKPATFFDFTAPFALVGRSNRCHIQLPDSRVSFRHTYLQNFGGRVFCVDLNSRTGTNWDGKRLRFGWLSLEQGPQIGPYQIRLAEPSSKPDEDFAFPVEFNPLDATDLRLSALGAISIEFLNRSNQGQTWTINRMLTLVGSGPGCKLRLEDEEISRVHCGLLVTKNGLWVIDFLGRGGTVVDGQMVDFARLEAGQILQVGQFSMRIRYQGERDLPPGGETGQASRELPVGETAQPESSLDLHESLETAAEPEPEPEPEPDQEISLAEFLNAVTENRLLSRAQIESVGQGGSVEEMSPAGLGDRLVARGLLTSWQVEQLVARRGHFLLVGDRYRLVERIGRGSMGTVYRADDLDHDRDVAIKFPKARAFRKPRMLGRFRREAMISDKLQHPSIVRTYEIAASGNYFVMEYVSGLNLKQFLAKAGAQSPEFSVRVAVQIGEALQFAHRNAVIHRDVKPSNILVSEEGTAKLLDLGLARVDDDSDSETDWGENQKAQLTLAGAQLGTTRYMAPEQAADGRDADTRSDIYSLACTLYELLAGAPPFDSSNPVEVLLKHATEPVAPIPGVDPRLMEIVERGLAKKPADRFQTPLDMVCRLRDWQTIQEQEQQITELLVARDGDRATISRDLRARLEAMTISPSQRDEILEAIENVFAGP